tara:strand:+ start:2569 stop:2826 length:258 start_codon:yes stop_codon:yes gene_type:complete
MDEKTSFTSEIGRILRESRDLNNDLVDNKLRLAVALATKLHISKNLDTKADIGRMSGPAFAQDHRRMRFGTNNLIQSRNSRSTWR